MLFNHSLSMLNSQAGWHTLYRLYTHSVETTEFILCGKFSLIIMNLSILIRKQYTLLLILESIRMYTIVLTVLYCVVHSMYYSIVCNSTHYQQQQQKRTQPELRKLEYQL